MQHLSPPAGSGSRGGAPRPVRVTSDVPEKMERARCEDVRLVDCHRSSRATGATEPGDAKDRDDGSLFTVYAPGGRYGFLANGTVGRVIARINPRKSTSEPARRWGRQRWTEAEHRQMLLDAGFANPTVRDQGAHRFVSCLKPSE